MSPRHSHRPSMVDVAQLAGVSYQTVSRVLNSPDQVADDTRQRVLRAMRQLGYRRNFAARALKRSRSDTLGLIHTGNTGVGPSSILEAVETAARERGLGTQVAVAENPTDEDSRTAIEHMMDYSIDGLIVISSQQWMARALRSSTLSIPVVAVEAGNHGKDNISVVAVDQYQGALDVVAHLNEQGYRRIDHITGPLDWFDAAERRRAWEDALAANPQLSGRVYEGDWSPQSGYEYGQRYGRDLPDAVFAGNDQMAIGLLHYLWEHNICVPERVAVVGVDDVSTAPYTCPALTSLRQPFAQVGVAVVDTMSQRLSGYGASTVSLPTQLIVRASTLRTPL